MSESFQFTRRVEFRDTDMAGIVHFSVFFTYMEQVEHEFLRHLDFSVIADVDGVRISWPRVAATCNYRRAIRFEQLIEIHLNVVRIGNSSVTYGFRFFEAGQPIADGEVTAVCCEFDHEGPPKSTAIPQTVRDRLQPYLVESK